MKVSRDLISIVPCVITVLYVTLGFGAQILQVLDRGTSSDLSYVMLSLGLVAFLSWTYYGVKRRRWEVTIPNGLGAIFSSALLAVCACH